MAKRLSVRPGELYRTATYIWRHPANRGERLRRLLAAACFRLRLASGRRIVISFGKTSRIWASLDHAGSILAAYSNPPDWPEWAFWVRNLRANDLFVDVGANIGLYSILAAEQGCRVVAFEPDPASAAALRANLLLNNIQDRVKVIQAAASDTEGTLAFFTNHDALGRVSLHQRGPEEVVKCVRLDHVVQEPIAALKIDVEGAERWVLEGAVDLLKNGLVRCIQIEWNDRSRLNFGEDRGPLADRLREMGFRLYRPDDDGVLIPWDGAEGRDVIAVREREPQGAGEHQ